MNIGSRLLRAAKALPELWIVLVLSLLGLLLRQFVPADLTGSLGWDLHPYQLFTVLVALGMFMLPGAMLIRFLQVGGSWVTRIPTYFAAAVGVWSIPGLIVAITASFDIEFLLITGLILTIILAAAAFAREVISPSDYSNANDEGRKDIGESLNPGLIFLSVLAVGAMIWISLTAPITLDDNLQLGYVQDNLVVSEINAYEPFFGAGIRPNTRGSWTTWPINLSLMAYLSGLPAQQTFWLLRTSIMVLGLFSIYTLSLRLFGNRNLAIFTSIFYCVLAVILTSESDAIGFGLFARAAQDKFVVRYILFPISLAWSLGYLLSPARRFYWLAGIVTIGLATTHPTGVILLGMCLVGFGVVHVINHFKWRSAEAPDDGGEREGVGDKKSGLEGIKALARRNWPLIRPFILLAVFCLAGLILPAIQQASPDAPVVGYSLTDTRDPSLWFRINLVINRYRLWIADYLGPDAYIVHPRVFLSVVILLPIVLIPILWWKNRKHAAVGLSIGTYIVVPLVLLVPPIVQLIGNNATPWLLYRFAWPLTLIGPLIIAWAAWIVLEEIGKRTKSEVLRTALPSAVLLVTMLILSAQIRVGLTTLSEIRKDPLISRCRTLQPMLSQLPDLVGDGTVVLSTPDMNACMPTSAAHAYPVEYFITSTLNRFPESRIPEAQQRLDDVNAFTVSEVVDRDFMDILTRWNVGLILLRKDHPVESQLQHMPQFFQLVLEEDRYRIYRVMPGIGTDTLPELEVKDRWNKARWSGEDPVVLANSLWTEGSWDEAIEIYQSLAEEGVDVQFLARIGEGRTHRSAGRLEEAITSISAATLVDPTDVNAWILLGEAYHISGDYEQMSLALEKATEIIDWHPEALRSLGDAYRFLVDEEKAQEIYQRSVAADAALGSAIYYRKLGSRYMAVNWLEEAVSVFQESLSIREANITYFFLSEAYRRLDQPENALEIARRSHRLEFWSDLPYITMGVLELDHNDREQALENFRKAITRNPQSRAIQIMANTMNADYGPSATLAKIQSLIGYDLGFSKALLSSGKLQLSIGQVDEGIASSEQAWDWEPVNAQAAILLGNIERALGHWEAAERYYRDAIAVKQSNSSAYLGLGAIARSQGDWGTAMGWTWDAMIAAPYDSTPMVAMGNILAGIGARDEAYETLLFASTTEPHVPRPFVSLGNFQLEEGNFDQASAHFQQAFEVQTENSVAMRGMSELYSSQGQLDESLGAAVSVVEVYPGQPANRVLLADILRQQGKPDEALDQLKYAIQLNPGYRLAFTRLADTYLQLGEIRQAEAAYRYLIQNHPEFVDGYVGMGQILEAIGDQDGATRVYQQALDNVAPSMSASARLALADMQRRQGLFEEALGNYQEAILQNPAFEEGYVGLAQFYMGQGNYSTGQEVLELGLQFAPASPQLNAALASILISQGMIKEAITTYQTALSLSPSSQELAINLASLYASVGEPEKAMMEIDNAMASWPGDLSVLEGGIPLAISIGEPNRALEMANELVLLAPGRGNTWVLLGDAYVSAGNYIQAEEAFRNSADVAPGDTSSWLALGNFLADRDMVEEAQEAFEKAVEVDKSNVSSHLGLAEIFDRSDQQADAWRELSAATELDATMNTALLAMGQIRHREGDLDEASRYYELAKEASPTDPQPYALQSELLLLQGLIEEAEDELVEATKAAEGSCYGFLNLADFLSQYGDWEAAKEAYTQSLKGAGCTVGAHVGLGNLDSVRAKPDEAIEQYRQAVSAGPGNPWGYIVLAESLGNQARWDEAFEQYSLAKSRVPASYRLDLSMSRSLTDRGDLEGALDAAQNAVDKSPSNSLVFMNLGWVYRLRGEYDQAEDNYQHATVIDKNSFYPFIYLGNLYNLSARFDEAEEAYLRSTILAPTDSSGYVALANFYQARGRTEDAVLLYKSATEVDKSQIIAILGLAETYQRMGDLDAAVQEYHRAINIGLNEVTSFQSIADYDSIGPVSPSTAGAFIGLGNLYRSQSNWDDAELAFQNAIEVAPASEQGYISLGTMYRALGRAEEAQTQIENATDVAPASGDALVALGDWSWTSGDFETAERTYKQAVDVDTGNPIGHIRLGEFCQLQDRPLEAIEHFNRAIQVAPTSTMAHVALGDWYQSQADKEAAKASFQEAIRVAAADPDGYLSLGDLHQAYGQRDAALTQYLEAEKVAPHYSEVYLALGEWYTIEANWASAEEVYRSALEVGPYDIRNYINLGEVLQAQDKVSEAYFQIQRALELVPSSTPGSVALANWYQLNMDSEAARKEYNEAIDEASYEVRLSVYNGLVYLGEGKIEEAYDELEAAMKSDPSSVLPYLALGQWYRLVSELGSAEESYNNAVLSSPGDPRGNLGMGELYLNEGRAHEAILQFEEAARKAPGYSYTHLALGQWYENQGFWEEAEQAYRKAIEVAPGNVNTFILLGELLERLGRQEEALRIFEEGVKAGLTPEAAVCSPGALPESPDEASGTVIMELDGRRTGQWRCQWEHRPWSITPFPTDE
ncbi:MAG: tetratricopeptide repeat protein [Anaerolineales bacterium]|nr:tetratricopeptide repeat protein [Anaerolineales bacterium]